MYIKHHAPGVVDQWCVSGIVASVSVLIVSSIHCPKGNTQTLLHERYTHISTFNIHIFLRITEQRDDLLYNLQFTYTMSSIVY